MVVGDDGDNEQMHIWQIDAADPHAVAKDLTPYPNSTSQITSKVKASLDLIITNNQRDKKIFDLYRLEHLTGKMTLLAQNPGDVARWLVNEDGILIGRVRKNEDTYTVERPRQTSSFWDTTFTFSTDDQVYPLSESEEANWFWALSNRNRDKLALVKINIETGEEALLHQDPAVDISQAFISKNSKRPLLVITHDGKPSYTFFDKRLEQAYVKLIPKNQCFWPLSMSDDETIMTGVISSDEGRSTVLYNFKTSKIEDLAKGTLSRIHAMSPLPLQKPISFTSRDGLTLHGYLTLPHGVTPKNLATVLLVHGGPWARDVWLGDSMPLFLANRGYAVLQINYRGSSGYGKAFEAESKGEFAAKMHDDLLDGVDWAIKNGYTDSNKVAIMGGSYGGYAAQVGMTFTPGVFACGISFVGMSDLTTLVKESPPTWKLGLPRWRKEIGDERTSEGMAKLKERSPLFRAEKVEGPMLFMHGVNDPRVVLSQSTRMVKALQDAGKSAKLITFKDDGHGNQKWSNNLTYYRQTEDFLASCLGGRSNGFDYFQLLPW